MAGEIDIAWLGLAALVGACFGSFITLASYRLPRELEIVRKSSHCPSCNATLGVKDLFPVLSWVVQKGQCRHCGKKIHWRYPAIEVVTALIFAALYAAYGISASSVTLALFAVALLVMVVADLEEGIIPDAVQWSLVPLGVLYNMLQGVDFNFMLTGALAGLGIGFALHYGYFWIRKRDGLGLGDVKFLGVAGVWIGAMNLVPFLFYAGILGTVTGLLWQRWEGGRFPFGPALSLSLFLGVLWPELYQFFWSAGGLVHRL